MASTFAEGTAPTGRLLQSDDEIRQLLQSVRRIAVVGLSRDPEKASHQVAQYLVEQGYEVVPIHPSMAEWQGRKCYSSVRAVPRPVDVVDIFRPSEAVPPHVEEAIASGARVVWMQLGIRNDEAALQAQGAGLDVVMDRCIKIEHSRLLGSEHGETGA